MATETEHYKLKKPVASDNYAVSDQNGNMDKLDEALDGLERGKAAVAHTHTAADVGALALSGGTISGTLLVNGSLNIGNGPFIKEVGGEELLIDASVVSIGRVNLDSGTIQFAPAWDDDITNKAYVDSKTLVFSGKNITTSAWVSNTTYSVQGYAWRASVLCTGVTSSHSPDVSFSCADSVSGNFAPVADSYAGGVYLYCKTKPTATVTIPSIVCVKGA